MNKPNSNYKPTDCPFTIHIPTGGRLGGDKELQKEPRMGGGAVGHKDVTYLYILRNYKQWRVNAEAWDPRHYCRECQVYLLTFPAKCYRWYISSWRRRTVKTKGQPAWRGLADQNSLPRSGHGSRILITSFLSSYRRRELFVKRVHFAMRSNSDLVVFFKVIQRSAK